MTTISKNGILTLANMNSKSFLDIKCVSFFNGAHSIKSGDYLNMRFTGIKRLVIDISNKSLAAPSFYHFPKRFSNTPSVFYGL